MKKTPLYLAVLSTLALASCAADDEPVNPMNQKTTASEAISFRSGMASRATETTNANLSSIYVTAFADDSTYFENENFVKGSDTYFTNPNRYEWLDKNDTITFFAYSPSMDDLGADIVKTEGKNGLTLESFAVASDVADQVDFITANAIGSRDANEATGVELTFDHRLSQIEIQAKSENQTYTIKVAGVRIGRPEYMGSFDFTTNTWTLDDWHDTEIYTLSCDTVTLGASAQNIMGPSGNAMLMPQTLTPWSPTGDPDNVAREAYLSVLVNITRTDNGYRVYPFPDDTMKDANGNPRQFGWASIPLSGTWEQGKKYVYTLDFTNGAGNVDPDDPNPGHPVLNGEIKFKVTVNDWVDAQNSIPMTAQTGGNV